jgi:hypothetical protein
MIDLGLIIEGAINEFRSDKPTFIDNIKLRKCTHPNVNRKVVLYEVSLNRRYF